MTHTVFIDLDSHVATASAGGTAAPNVPLKHLTKQTLAFAFHSGGTVQAVTGWVSGRVIVKATPTSDVLLLDTTLVVTGSTTSTRYSAEWASADCDSAAMRTLIGASTEPLDVWAEIQWTDAEGTYAVAFPIQIVPTFNLPEDDPPDPVADASWTWLKARLAAGTNVTFSDNDTTKVRTISAALSEVAWAAITGTPTTLAGYGITDAQPLNSALTTLANGFGGIFLGTGIIRWTGTTYALQTGAIGPTVGGTGLTGYTLGDLIYADSPTTLAKLAGNTENGVKKFLSQTAAALQSAAPEWSTLAKGDVGLGNVENTALSTWAGSANITTIGTIASGTWQGSVIAPAYLGTGTDITTKFLRGDGTWQAVSSGITINTTAITGGTSGRVLYNNGGTVGEFTGLTIATGALQDISSTGRIYGASQTGYPQFTETGYPGNGMRVYSDRIDFWISSTPIFTVYSTQVDFGSAGMAWTSNTKLFGNSDGTGRLVQRVGTTAQSFSVANTYTSFTNKEEVETGWTSNIAHLWTIKGSGGGTARALAIGTDSTARINIGASGELGFFGATAIAKPTVTGAHGGNAALQSLIAAMANLGLITDSTS